MLSSFRENLLLLLAVRVETDHLTPVRVWNDSVFGRASLFMAYHYSWIVALWWGSQMKVGDVYWSSFSSLLSPELQVLCLHILETAKTSAQLFSLSASTFKSAKGKAATNVRITYLSFCSFCHFATSRPLSLCDSLTPSNRFFFF